MPFQGKKPTKIFLPVIVILLVVGLLFAFIGIDLVANNAGKEPDVFVGVDIGFGNENDVYRIADAVQGYANLIILGSSMLTSQTENLTRVCDYLYQRGFSFIVYIGFSMNETGFPPNGPDPKFFNQNVGRWGASLLGLYIFDEPGGKQTDYNSSIAYKPVPRANNIHDAAVHFDLGVEPYTNLYRGETYYAAQSLGLYTSDYALYWFDYISGYTTILGEFTGNNSRQIAIALNRGASEALGKEWGTIITWKYDAPPYMEDAGQLYDDMVLAYENGANYVVVFDSPGGTPQNPNPPTTTYGILTTEHFDAMKRFWNYAKANPRTNVAVDTAYVLPKDWGFGFRGPNDTIWGLWPADSLAPKVWNDTQALLAEHGKNLDIVYETRIDNVDITLPYSTLIFWNGTIVKR